MALPDVRFNSSTGSDTAASGAGPSVAIFGAAGAHTGGISSTTVQLPALTDLSGVATDGSAVLWLNTTSGRQFSKITGVDDGLDQVTTEDAFNIALASAVDWAIGGKRATLEDADSRTLFVVTNGAKPGWTITVETNQTITTALTISAAGSTSLGWIRFFGGAAEGSHITIDQTANAACLTGNIPRWHIRGFKFTNSNGTKTSARGYTASGTAQTFIFEDCIFGDQTNQLIGAFSIGVQPEATFLNCSAIHCTSSGFTSGGASSVFMFIGCVSRNNGGSGWQPTLAENYNIINCIGYDNDVDGLQTTIAVTVVGCTFHGNTSDGISIGSMANSIFIGNNLTGNGAFGLTTGGLSEGDVCIYADFNNYGSGDTENGAGARSGIVAGPNDLAVDPGYVDAAGGNFSPTTAVLGKGYPDEDFDMGAGESTSNTHVDVGAVQGSGIPAPIISIRRLIR